MIIYTLTHISATAKRPKKGEEGTFHNITLEPEDPPTECMELIPRSNVAMLVSTRLPYHAEGSIYIFIKPAGIMAAIRISWLQNTIELSMEEGGSASIVPASVAADVLFFWLAHASCYAIVVNMRRSSNATVTAPRMRNGKLDSNSSFSYFLYRN